MPDLTAIEKQIFEVSSADGFNDLSLKIFHFQYSSKTKTFHGLY